MAEPVGRERGRHFEDEHLRTAQYHLPEEGEPEGVRIGTTDSDERSAHVQDAAGHHAESQAVLLDDPGAHPHAPDVGQHVDHRQPAHPVLPYPVELGSMVRDGGEGDPGEGVSEGEKTEEGEH